MRFSTVLVMCLMLSACGRTGALYLPEKPPAPADQDAQQQNPDVTNDEKAN